MQQFFLHGYKMYLLENLKRIYLPYFNIFIKIAAHEFLIY